MIENRNQQSPSCNSKDNFTYISDSYPSDSCSSKIRKELLHLNRIIDWNEISNEDFMEMATGSRRESSAFVFQIYLERSAAIPLEIEWKISRSIPYFLTHRNGCHLLVLTLTKSKRIIDELKEYLETVSIVSLALNDKASRALQKLAEVDEDPV